MRAAREGPAKGELAGDPVVELAQRTGPFEEVRPRPRGRERRRAGGDGKTAGTGWRRTDSAWSPGPRL